MPELAPAEREAFLKRLQKLDLDESAVLADELTITANTKTTLSRSTMGSKLEPLILRTKDLDDVRRWVGLPEPVAAEEGKRPSSRLATVAVPGAAVRQRVRVKAQAQPAAAEAMPAEFSAREIGDLVTRAGGGMASARALKVEQLDVLRSAARAYVRGNKAAASAYKPAIEAMFVEFEVAAWLFRTVRVGRNAVLEFGTGVHHLTAYKVIMEPGAKIRSYGHLTVDCVVHEAPSPIVLGPLTHVLVNP